MKRTAKLGLAALATVGVLCAIIGGCVGKAVSDSNHKSAEQAAFERLRGTGNVPSTTTESYGGFQPSDAPPRCLPTGTVTYEIYDSAAKMRYWVFRWPENGGYSVVPRLELSENGVLAPYSPPYVEVTDDAE